MSDSKRKRFSILVTNDDGYDAPGIQVLAEVLGRDHEVVVVAPDGERSGYSAAISVGRPISWREVGPGRYKVGGTPADAAHLGIRHFMEQPPDLVVSGINRGPNLGNDTIFSGTVGAANSACLDGVPAIAVSTGDAIEPIHYETAAEVVAGVVASPGFLEHLGGRVLNINVPNRPFKDLKGIRETDLGLRLYPRHFEPCRHQPEDVLWYAPGVLGHQGHDETDVMAIEAGEVSLTFLRPLLQDRASIEGSENWQVPAIEKLVSSSIRT